MATCGFHYPVGGKYLTRDEVNERLKAIPDREAFKRRYHFREHTLENWAYMSPSTTLKVCRALSEQPPTS